MIIDIYCKKNKVFSKKKLIKNMMKIFECKNGYCWKNLFLFIFYMFQIRLALPHRIIWISK